MPTITVGANSPGRRGGTFSTTFTARRAPITRAGPLEILILQAAKSPDVNDVTILAHSMGGWLAAEALRGVAMREKSIPAKVKNVILPSPDIDTDVFRRQFTEIGQAKRPNFAILTSTPEWTSLERSREPDLSVNLPLHCTALYSI